MAETLAQIITAVASRGGFHLRDVATGGSQITLTAAKLIQRDGYWNGKYIYCITGANAGLERVISGYVNKSLEFDSFTYTVGAGDEFEIAEFAHDDLLMVVQEAISAAGSDWMAIVTDESMELSTTTQIYAMPDDLVSILSIDYYATNQAGQTGTWMPITSYEIYGAAGSRKLQMRQFAQSSNPNAGSPYPMRIQYVAMPALLTDNTDTLNLGEMERSAVAYIKEMALHFLNEQRFERNRTGEDARACLTAAQQHMAKAEALRLKANVVPATRRYSTRTLPRHI